MWLTIFLCNKIPYMIFIFTMVFHSIFLFSACCVCSLNPRVWPFTSRYPIFALHAEGQKIEAWEDMQRHALSYLDLELTFPNALASKWLTTQVEVVLRHVHAIAG